MQRHRFCNEKIALTPFLLVLAVIAGCGFHMRGTESLPFRTMYIPGATGGIALDLKRNIQSGTDVKLVDDAKSADAILELANERREKIILSLSGSGRVREFRLRYSVSFRVHDLKGQDFVPTSTVQLTRDMTYDDTEILAKEAEEQLLFRDMQTDMVQQVLRRLAAAQLPKPSVP
jgi:LPS-assembly lipoprotein